MKGVHAVLTVNAEQVPSAFNWHSWTGLVSADWPPTPLVFTPVFPPVHARHAKPATTRAATPVGILNIGASVCSISSNLRAKVL